MKNLLSDWGIAPKGSDYEIVFTKLVSDLNINEDNPMDYVKKLWIKYKQFPEEYQKQIMCQKIFEALVYTSFIKEKIMPFYFETELEFVPDIKYDLLVYPKKGDSAEVSRPLVLFLRNSIMDCTGQIDLEGLALKKVYKKAKTLLITLDDLHIVECFQRKIYEKEIRGIDKCINIFTKDYADVIYSLKSIGVDEVPNIQVVK